MAHYCKCVECGERFDRDKVPFIKISERRYGHKSCIEEKREKEKITRIKLANESQDTDQNDLKELESYR